MPFSWKENWPESRERYLGWWDRRDSVIVTGGVPRATPRSIDVEDLTGTPPRSDPMHYTDSRRRAIRNHRSLAGLDFPADTLPLSGADIGPGSLALLIGSEPGFSDETVWFEPYEGPETDPAADTPFTLDPENPWWKIHRETLKEAADLGGIDYRPGCPDLVENIDILAALRGPEQLLVDMIEEPGWVETKVAEINQIWFDAFDLIYSIIADENGGSCFHAFHLWGPGKTAKVQCDACAMFSPEMFDRYVLPALTAQCEWLDNSMYHLDGHQCMVHLNSLLAIESLDAIEWTPDPRVPPGGDPEWYDLYKRILDAGKSVQAVGVKPEQVVPLLEAVGHRGMFIHTRVSTRGEAEELMREAAPYRER